jgi:hypothetical protein
MPTAVTVTAELSEPSSVPLVVRAAPALISLLYPALVWSVHAISPFAFALTLLAPVVCLYIVFGLAMENCYRGATMVAYFAVGAPALYSFLGGWLDSQKWIPFQANGVWVVLWCVLVFWTTVERPAAVEASYVRSARLAFAHGISAAAITTFAVFHLSNHLAGLLGGEAHLAVMRVLRLVYRQGALEVLLGACILFQVASGSVLLWRRTRQPARGWIEVLQNASGAYLILFFASHMSAVLRARYLHHIDTNWIWLTKDNLLTDSWSVRLVPYYFLGIVALAVHGGCGLRWVLAGHGQQRIADRVFIATVAGGGTLAVAILIGLVRGSLGSLNMFPLQ